MTLYASLDFVKQFLKTEQATVAVKTADEQRLLQLIRIVSRRVDLTFGSRIPLFAPTIGTWKARIDGYHTNAHDGTLSLDWWLLGYTGATVSGTAVTAEGYPDANYPPFKALKLTDTYADWYGYCTTSGTPTGTGDISGIRGFHRDGLGAFVAVDALAAGINASVTTLTVADVDGADEYGITPRLSAGHLIRVDDEYMEVINTSPAGNTLTVIRAANGSTSAAHDAAASVEVWRVEEVVQYAVARQVGLMFARRGSYNSVEVNQYGGEIRFPSDWLTEVRGMMNNYAYL